MPVSMLKALVCCACELPVHAETASQLGLPRCACKGVRRQKEEKIRRHDAIHPVRRCVQLGILAADAIRERQRADAVSPRRLDQALARVRPAWDRATAQAQFLIARHQRSRAATGLVS